MIDRHFQIPLGLAVLTLTVAAVGLAQAAPSGALAWDKQTHDFGDVGQHEEHEAVFRFTNEAEERVTGIRAGADCGCYGLTLSHTDLEPGESGTLTVRFRTLAFSGRLKKYVSIAYTDAKRRSLRLGLVMAVRAGVILEPGRMHFGEVLAGTKPAGSIRALYYEGLGKRFEITDIRLPDGDFVPPKPAPYQDERDPRWKGFTIPLAFARPLDKGIYSKQAIIQTDHPDHPTITVSLTATVVGRVWVRQPRIYLGMIPHGSERRTHTLIRPFDASIELGAVTASADDSVLDVSIMPVEGRAGHYRVEIAVPADAPPGRIDDVVLIRTELPGEPPVEVSVKGRVIKRRGG